MKRGFKAQAERLALSHREKSGVGPNNRLDPRSFLNGNDMIVWEPTDVPGFDGNHLEQLVVKDANSWSGVTIKVENQILIIINPTHPKGRQANTLMHEWSHIELRHKPNRVDRSEDGLLLLSDYPKELEDEADWLAGCMLLPRDGLLHHCRSGKDVDEIAMHYGVSTQLANWRIGKTGIRRQISSRQY